MTVIVILESILKVRVDTGGDAYIKFQFLMERFCQIFFLVHENFILFLILRDCGTYWLSVWKVWLLPTFNSFDMFLIDLGDFN